DYLFPVEFIPGSVLMSKTVLTDDRIIDIISQSLKHCPQDIYMTAPTKCIDKSACDVLYLPKGALCQDLPIIIEVQKE
ncbi:hypothetical protein BD408DRAFT_328591, partial [Parasitella parasitica]